MFFSNTKYVLEIKRGSILLNKVKLGRTTKLVSSSDYSYQEDDDFVEIFTEIKKIVRDNDLRILISEDLSYVVRINLPTGGFKDKIKEREFIFEKLREEIPEELSQGDWDYKEIKSRVDNGEDNFALAIACVGGLLDKIKNALNITQLRSGIMEPEMISKTRDSNPVVGITLKEDIKGRDERVLNLLSGNISDKHLMSDNDDFKVLKKNNLLILILAVFLLFVIAGSILYWIFFLKNQKLKSEENKKTTDISLTTSQATPTIMLEKEEIVSKDDLKELNVIILNGSGIAGKALTVKNSLKDEGFAEIFIGNADTKEYLGTTIKMKESVNIQVYDLILDNLGGNSNISLSDDFLVDDLSYDIEIIIGK